MDEIALLVPTVSGVLSIIGLAISIFQSLKARKLEQRALEEKFRYNQEELVEALISGVKVNNVLIEAISSGDGGDEKVGAESIDAAQAVLALKANQLRQLEEILRGLRGGAVGGDSEKLLWALKELEETSKLTNKLALLQETQGASNVR